MRTPSSASEPLGTRRRGQPAPRGAPPYRLTGLGAFDAVFKTGRRKEGAYLQLVYAPARAIPGRVGFALAKKALPLAVDRNRVRRMLRVILRTARPHLHSLDVIVRLKRGASRNRFRVIAGEAEHLLLSLYADQGLD